MDSLEIPYEVTPVGDRHVVEAIGRLGATVGGEQSGHVILPEYVTTGDGMVTALALLDVMARSGKPLSELADVHGCVSAGPYKRHEFQDARVG